MQKSKSKSKRSSFNPNTKNFNHSKSKFPSKASSKKASKSSIYLNTISNSNTKLKKLLLIQKHWQKYYNSKIKNKIIKIQSVFRGYYIREMFHEVYILNKKLESFFFIVKLTMFRHAMKYDYLSNKRIDYYSNHKNTKYFLLLQRRIRYFLFMKKIKILDKLGIFNDVYIITKEYRTKIKSKMTLDKYLAKPILKFHRPLTKIKMIQKNYLIHAKIMKKINKQKINKIFLNKCPLITKEEKYKTEEISEDNNKNILNKVINIKKDFYTKVNYNYTPLTLIQKRYKERFNYLKENYKLKKHSKLLKKVKNKHHYIYHSYVVSSIFEVLTIQKNIRYFLYRKHSMVNLVKKLHMKKCEIKKQYEIRGNVKKYFYEEFVRRLIIIIRRTFLSINLKILKKTKNIRKVQTFGLNDYNYIDSSKIGDLKFGRKRSALSSEFVKTQKIKQQMKKKTRKETFSRPSNKNLPIEKQSNLLNSSDAKNYKDRNIVKKVTFRSEVKSNNNKDFKNILSSEEKINDNVTRTTTKNMKNSIKNSNRHKTVFMGNNLNIPYNKGK